MTFMMTYQRSIHSLAKPVVFLNAVIENILTDILTNGYYEYIFITSICKGAIAPSVVEGVIINGR